MIIQCTREVADIQRRSTVNLWRWCACVSSGARPFPRSGPWIPGRVKVSHCFPRSTGVQAVYTCRNQLPPATSASYLSREMLQARVSQGRTPSDSWHTEQVPSTDHLLNIVTYHTYLSHLRCITLSHFFHAMQVAE